MSDVNAKMHRIRFRLGLTAPGPAGGGELTALLGPSSWISEVLLLRRREMIEKEGKGE